MKWLLVLPILLLFSCKKPLGEAQSLHVRLNVTNESVHLGKTSLPSDGEALSEHIIGLAPGDDAKREVDLVFAENTSGARMHEMFNAVLSCSGYAEDLHIPFNVAGRSGPAFRLDLRDVFCCSSRSFIPADECMQAASCPGAEAVWVNMELWFQEEASVLDGEPMDAEQIRTRLQEVRPMCLGILVMISMPHNATIRDLVPVIELCESAGASVNLSFEEQEEEDRHMRRLRSRMMMPAFVTSSVPPGFTCSFAEEISQ